MGDYDFEDDYYYIEEVQNPSSQGRRRSSAGGSVSRTRPVDIESGLKDLKLKHYGVLQEDRSKNPLPKYDPQSPKRGKIRPKSAPAKVKPVKKAHVAYNDEYEERPKFSKVALDRIAKTSQKNSAAQQSGNRPLKETAEFATKMKKWGKGGVGGEKNARQGSKKQQEQARKAALEEDAKLMLGRQGADVTRSMRRIRTFQDKERSAKAEIELEVYDETMNSLLHLFDALNRANTICMGCFSNIRYEVHHKQGEDDLAFWSLARQLIKSYKKETSFMALHDDHPELGLGRRGGGPGLEHNANHYHSKSQLERHRKVGQDLLRLGCGTRLANLFIEELQYSDNVVLPSSAAGLPVGERGQGGNVIVKRLMSLEKFQNVVLRGLIANSFGNQHKHGYEATTATSAIHNAGAVTVLEDGRTSDDLAVAENAVCVEGAPPKVRFAPSVSVSAVPAPAPAAPVGDQYAEEDVAYYSAHVLRHEGGGWNKIVEKMKQYQGGSVTNTKASRQCISLQAEHIAAPLRVTETVLLSVIQNTLNARKQVELQLADIQGRGWNAPHMAPPPS